MFPQSDDIIRRLPQGIGFWKWEIYILAKGYFFAKVLLSLSYYKMGLKKCKVGGDEMYNFSQELNYDIMQENYIKDLQELLMEFDEVHFLL